MNQFKEDLNRELQPVSLSEEKKQLIATKAKAKLHNHKRHINLQYRFVLAIFTIFAIGFSYLLWQQEGPASKAQGAAPIEPITTTTWSMLTNDFSKAVLYISFFIILRALLKRRFQKNGKGLPICVECGEEWSYREALKQSMKNTKMTCPYCGQIQYRTKKSRLKGGMLNIFIPFMIIAPQLFDNILLGIVVHVSCAAYIMFSLGPYYLELQKKDPINDPLW